jgi:glucans biosynthesis protein C
MVDATALKSLQFDRKVDAASTPRTASPTSLALDNLRGIVILIVLGFHSALAYLSWIAVSTAGFDHPPYAWRAFPIVDSHHFFGFDLLCAWQDVYLMSLMFFLSGLFVWPSLTRKKDWGFACDRVLRLGIPYLFGITVVIPIATYPAYLATGADPGLVAYWHALLALPFWPNGPLWFLWQLLALNLIIVLVHRLAPDTLVMLGRRSASAGTRIAPYFAALVAASAVAYVPLALACTPWSWSNSGPFAVQFCRPLNYAVYFFAGVGVGVEGVDRGLVAVHGALARHWARWLGFALAAFGPWMALTALTLKPNASLGVDVASDLAYVIACAAGCFFLIAITVRFAAARSPILGRLGADAYGLYLFHYVFVVWLQYLLLAMPLFAFLKAVMVFSLTLVSTWITVTVIQRVPLCARLIGSTRRHILRLSSGCGREKGAL